jgi:hypothetical protein
MAFAGLAVASAGVGLALHMRVYRLDQVRHDCRLISRHISEFVSDRRRDDPVMSGRVGVQSIVRHHTETVARYNERLASQALAIFDDAARMGLVLPTKRDLVEHPTNFLGIEEVAQILGAVGHGTSL